MYVCAAHVAVVCHYSSFFGIPRHESLSKSPRGKMLTAGVGIMAFGSGPGEREEKIAICARGESVAQNWQNEVITSKV